MPYEVKIPLMVIGGASLQAILGSLGVSPTINYCLGLWVGINLHRMIVDKFR